MSTEEELSEADLLVASVNNTHNLRFDAVNRTIFLWADIDGESAGSFIATFMAMDRLPGTIRVVMHSHGGDSAAGFAIYDVIKMARNRVIIDVYGACMSIAAVILQAGDLRRLTKNSEFMIHNGSIDTDGDTFTSKDMELNQKRLATDDRLIHRIFAHRTGLKLAKVKDMCSRDTFLSAKQAVKLGFADAIITEPS